MFLSKDFSFLSIILFVINTRFLKFIIKNKSNEDVLRESSCYHVIKLIVFV